MKKIFITCSVNKTGQFAFFRAAILFLKAEKQGAVLLMSYAARRLALPICSPYTAAKWGVVELKKTFAMVLELFSITVNAIQPGSIQGSRIKAMLATKAKANGISLEYAQVAEVQNVSFGSMIDPNKTGEPFWFIALPTAFSSLDQSIGLCRIFDTH